VSKLCQQLGILKYSRDKLSLGALRTIYYSLAHSKMIYGIEVWGTAFPTILKPVQTIQNKLIRAITYSSPRTSVIPLARQHKILPLTHEIEYRRLLASYKILASDQHPIEIEREHAHMYGTRFASNNLPIPVTRLKRYGTMGIKRLMIQSYNSLPTELKALCPDRPRLFKAKAKQLIWMSV
jgi:hypothetical protein